MTDGVTGVVIDLVGHHPDLLPDGQLNLCTATASTTGQRCRNPVFHSQRHKVLDPGRAVLTLIEYDAMRARVCRVHGGLW